MWIFEFLFHFVVSLKGSCPFCLSITMLLIKFQVTVACSLSPDAILALAEVCVFHPSTL